MAMKKKKKLQILTPEWAAPLLEPAQFLGAFGGRAGGKSYFFAGRLVEEHICFPNQKSVCFREKKTSTQYSIKALIEEIIYKYQVESFFDIQRTCIIDLRGRGRIVFEGLQSHTADSIKSFQGFNRALYEEAQTFSQRSLDLSIPTIRAPGSQQWFIWNPELPTDPVDVRFRKEKDQRAIIVSCNYTDNPFVTKETLAEADRDKRINPSKYAHIWLGRYIENSDARVFQNWIIEEFEAPLDSEFRFGADWGFSIDPSVLVRCYLVGKKMYIDYEAYQLGCSNIDLPDLFMTIPEAEKWTIIADSQRPDMIDHMRNHGFPKMQGAVKGAGSLKAGVEWLQSYEIIVHPRCKHVADELTLYSYKINSKTNEVLPMLKDADNHIIDSLRYACESLRRAQAAAKEANKYEFSEPPRPIQNYWKGAFS